MRSSSRTTLRASSIDSISLVVAADEVAVVVDPQKKSERPS